VTGASGYIDATTVMDCDFRDSMGDEQGSCNDPRTSFDYFLEPVFGSHRLFSNTTVDMAARPTCTDTDPILPDDVTGIEAITDHRAEWDARRGRSYTIKPTLRHHPLAHQSVSVRIQTASGGDFTWRSGEPLPVWIEHDPVGVPRMTVTANCEQYLDPTVPVWCSEWVGVEVLP
jgi:hypothetical protein